MANKDDDDYDELQPEPDTQNRTAVEQTSEQRKAVRAKVTDLVQQIENRSFTVETLTADGLKLLVGKQLGASYAQVAANEAKEAKEALAIAKNLINAITGALKSCYVVSTLRSTSPDWVFDSAWAKQGRALEDVLHHVGNGFISLFDGFEELEDPPPSKKQDVRTCYQYVAFELLDLFMEIATSEKHAKLSARVRREFCDLVSIVVSGQDGKRGKKMLRENKKYELGMAQLVGKTKDRHLLDTAFKIILCVYYLADTPIDSPGGMTEETQKQSTSKTNTKQKNTAKDKGKGKQVPKQNTIETQEERDERLGNLFFGTNAKYNDFTPELSKWLIKQYQTVDGKALLRSITKRVAFSKKLVEAIIENDFTKPQQLIIKSIEVPHYETRLGARVCLSSVEEQTAAEKTKNNKQLEYALYINERSITTWMESIWKPEVDENGIWELELLKIQAIDFGKTAENGFTLVTFKSISPSEFWTIPLPGVDAPQDGLYLTKIHIRNESVVKLKETLLQRYLPALKDKFCLKAGTSVTKQASRQAKVVAKEQIKPPKASQPMAIAGPDRTPPAPDGVDALKARVEGLENIVNQPDTSEESVRADSMQASRRSSRETAVQAREETIKTATIPTTVIEGKTDGTRVEKTAVVSKVEAVVSAPEQTGFDLSEDSGLSDLEDEEQKDKHPKKPAEPAEPAKKSAAKIKSLETGSKRKLSEERSASKNEKRQRVSREDSAESELPDISKRKKDQKPAPVKYGRQARDSGFDEVLPPPIQTTNDHGEDSGEGTDYDSPADDLKKKGKQGTKEVKKPSTTAAAKKSVAARKVASSTPVKKRGSRGGASESDSSKTTTANARNTAPKGRTRAAKAAAAQAITDQAQDNASQTIIPVDLKTKAKVTSDVPPDSDPVEPQAIPSAAVANTTVKAQRRHPGDSSANEKQFTSMSQLFNSNLPEVPSTKEVEQPETDALDRTTIWEDGISNKAAQRKTSAKETRKATPQVIDEPRTDDAFKDLLADPPTFDEDPVRQFTTVLDNVSAASVHPEPEEVGEVNVKPERNDHRRSVSVAAQVEKPLMNILPPSLTGFKPKLASVVTHNTQKVEDPAGVLSSPSGEPIFGDRIDDMHLFSPVNSGFAPDYSPMYQDRRAPDLHEGLAAMNNDDANMANNVESMHTRNEFVIPPPIPARQAGKLQQAEPRRKAVPTIMPQMQKDDITGEKPYEAQASLPTETLQKRAQTVPAELPASKGVSQPAKLKPVRASKMRANLAQPPPPPPADQILHTVASVKHPDLRVPEQRESVPNKYRTAVEQHLAIPTQHDYDEVPIDKRFEPEKYGRRASSVMEASPEPEIGIMSIMQKLNQVLLSDLKRKKEAYCDSRDNGVDGIVQVVQAGLTQASKADAAYFSGLKDLNEQCHDLQKRAAEPLASLEKEISNECKRITADAACLGQIKSLFAKRCPVGMFAALPTCAAIQADDR